MNCIAYIFPKIYHVLY